jgi:cyclophilin family peptidyl-prolyl cis-trans isomerase
MSARFGVLLAVLESLRPGAASLESVLEPLASTPLEGADPPLARRIVLLRCSAAAVLAKTRSLYPALKTCDPDREGRAGLLAVVRVLDRAPITEARAARFRELLEARNAVVRQAALDLLPGHPEIAAPHDLLARALAAKEDGTVATAARVLAAYPDRGTEGDMRRRVPAESTDATSLATVTALKPASAVLRALDESFKRPRHPDALEVRTSLVDAVAALQLLSYKPAIEGDCKSPYPTLREHAERALRLLGDKNRSCNATVPHVRAPQELNRVAPAALRLRFRTDAGDLGMILHGEAAPVAVARVQQLVQNKFYDGIRVHRVVPGFVAQFGDPGGDGYGGAALPALPCETSPLRFESGRVGVALSGRDTGSSQLFVTLGPQPHLDGKYSLLGHAEPGWERLAPGDVIHEVTILP